MSCALRCPAAGRQATASYARQPSSSNQLLRQLARFHPNQLSSYIGVKLLLPAKGRIAMTLQGSAAVRKPVQMSFLGVGAPEAILVAVVALVVFGPKGLADAARSVGSTLRAFKPTIKEVVQVSQELKGTLEKELGIDELRDAARPVPARPMTELDMAEASGPAGTTVSETMAKVLDPEIEAKRAASAQMAWGAATAAPAAASASESAGAATTAAAPRAAPAAATTVAPSASAAAPAVKDIAAMSMEELEAELARRRSAAAGPDKRQ